jgi:hypothetical protein
MLRIVKIWVVLTTLMLAACASVPMTGKAEDQEAKQFKAPVGQSRIYIYRDEILGSAIKVTVSLDGKLIGQTAPHTYFAVDVKPGLHKVTCLAESNSEVSFTTKPGAATYIWQEMKMGAFSAGCALREVDANQAQSALKSCERAQAN